MTFYTIVPVYVNEKIIFHLEMLTACGASVTMNIVMLHLYVTFYARLAAELVAAFVAHVTATFMCGTNVHLGIFGSTVHLATESARVLSWGVDNLMPLQMLGMWCLVGTATFVAYILALRCSAWQCPMGVILTSCSGQQCPVGVILTCCRRHLRNLHRC